MQYTTQQLQGGPKYSHKTRIGNWNEDFELTAVQQANYQAKKDSNALPFAKTLAKYQGSYRQVPWTHSADGNLCWGDQVMVQNAATQGWLVVDIGEKVPNVLEAYSITSTGEGQNPGPMTRSMFQLKRVDQQDIFGSDKYVRYGQKVRLAANSHLFRKQLSLASYPQTGTVASAVSNRQCVSMSSEKGYEGVWVLDHVDPNQRFELQGEIIRANEPLLFRHVGTNVFLATDPANKYKNDFGTEHEVYCSNHSTANKSQNLEMERSGRLTVDVPSKFQKPQNLFMIVTAPEPSLSRTIEELAAFDMTAFLKEIKQKIFERSGFGLRSLRNIFRAMDEKADGCLDVDDFRWGLIDYGISVTKDEAAEVLGAFDRNGDGKVSFNEFLVTLKGDLTPAREAVIGKAYKKLDANGDGTVRLDDIAKLYDASQHPEVISGKKSEQDIFMEYMSLWDTQVKDGIVTLDEFKEYYKDISASVDTDEEFCAILKSAWKLEDE